MTRIGAGQAATGGRGALAGAGRLASAERPVDITAGNLAVRLAETVGETEAAQALRYRIFYEIMGARPLPGMEQYRRDHDGYDQTADEMEAAARAMPGFVDFKSFTAADGERVSIATFDSVEHHEAWRDDTRHRAAQQRGRKEWYAEYHIQVCELRTERRFPH